jgi:Ala-tRNA(Pro) deacylase
MNYTKEDILTYLSSHEIRYTLYSHEPLFTCEQAQEIIGHLNLPGTGVKNLFLKDKAKKLYLITACDNTRIDLKAVSKTLHAKDLRFADADLMQQHLGVTPGSVTPLALINDKEHVVQPIIDAALLEHAYIQIHPMQNDATVVISPEDLIKFFGLIERSYAVYDFGEKQTD